MDQRHLDYAGPCSLISGDQRLSQFQNLCPRLGAGTGLLEVPSTQQLHFPNEYLNS